jgi:hypothetical protein
MIKKSIHLILEALEMNTPKAAFTSVAEFHTVDIDGFTHSCEELVS